MGTTVSRWGNSLAVRIPKASLEAADLHEGNALTIRSERGTLVLRRSSEIDIVDMIESITAATLPDEPLDFPPIGRERL
jgi:antitoxin MazE